MKSRKSISERGLWFLGNPKKSKRARPKIQRFHAHPKLFQNNQYLSNNMFELIVLFKFIHNHSRFTKIPPSFFPKRSETPIVFGPKFRANFLGVWWWPRCWTFSDFQNIQIRKTVFRRCSHIFLYVVKYLGDK